jgi:hypothetical protein
MYPNPEILNPETEIATWQNFTENDAASRGAGIATADSTSLVVRDSYFASNTAVGGAAISQQGRSAVRPNPQTQNPDA